jgi:hypothetical protein
MGEVRHRLPQRLRHRPSRARRRRARVPGRAARPTPARPPAHRPPAPRGPSDPGGRDHRHLALHPVEHRDDRGAHQHRVGQAERVGVHVRQMLDQPDHVVAEIAEQPGGGGGQVGGHVDGGFRPKPAQRVQRRGLAHPRTRRGRSAPAVQAAVGAPAFPDQVGLHPDDRIAPAHLAAGHRFEDEGVAARIRQLQHHRDRRVEIGGQPGVDQLVPAFGPAGLEFREIGGQGHRARLTGTVRGRR